MSMNSRVYHFQNLDITADMRTDEFVVRGGEPFTIDHSAAGSTPTGTWYLETYNLATAAWETYADASGEFTNPAAADASGQANFTNPPIGRCRMFYDYTSGGSSTGGDIVVNVG